MFIDEVQKAPRILDIVQRFIDEKGARFAISGSSARKLRHGGGNLLAGRAFSFLRTTNDQELDLVIDRPGMPTLVIEIKSTRTIRGEHTEVAARLGKDIPDGEILVLSRDPEPKQYGLVTCRHWCEGIDKIFEG